MTRVALFEPRIPQNTGNIGRTCAAFNIPLDLIEPFGFSLEDRYLKRAGLDYWKYIDIHTYISFQCYINTVKPKRIIAFSKKSNLFLPEFEFDNSDVLLFGREDKGLPEKILDECNHVVSIPMPMKATELGTDGIRSLNLSVACGIGIYSSQLGYAI